MASRSEHQALAEQFVSKAEAWLPDPETEGETEFRQNAFMCDLNARIAQVHATLAGN